MSCCIAYLQLLGRLDLRWYDADAQGDFVVLNRQTVGWTYSRDICVETRERKDSTVIQ
eukprot:COSAG06_NODE_14292_length_1169_cov_1.784112_1_plen_57_part_10